MEAIDTKLQKSYFDVLGLCCTSEVPIIEKILRSVEGVKDFSVIVPTKTVVVVHDLLIVSDVQIVKALNQARLEANIRVHGQKNYKNKWPSPYAIICGILLLLSFFNYFYSPLKWLAVGAIAVGIPPILLKAVSAVRNLTLEINILVLIAVAGSIALKDYWEAATIVFLFTIAEWLEMRASHGATAAMSSLVSLVPQKATIAETGEEVNADEVKLNTLLAVKAGETIPIDGIVVEGNCEVDEKILTGESFPASKDKDSNVWASTINLNGYITIRTTVVAQDCVVARMSKLVEEAQNRKSKTQRFIDKCAKYYTPVIVAISACIAIIPLVLHVHNKGDWYRLALVVLVSGCPCALLLSTPVAMFCALSRAAMLGVLFKGAEHLETLAQIKIMAFDKTGTITRGEFSVADVKLLQDDFSLNKILFWISSIESKSSHPMAAALVDFAGAHEIEPKPDQVENFQNFPGEGIYGCIEGNEIYIGNSKVASRAGCSEVPQLEGYDTEGKSIGYVFIGSSPGCIVFLTDVCRTGAKEAIQELKSIGIKTVMLTGDCHAAARHTQVQLNNVLEVIHSELLPEDKARIIKELETEGLTAMVGDGVNDAIALATANIGISMGVSGSALATESGDVVLMSNDVQRIPRAVRIAKRVKRKIIENVIISFTTKAGILGLAIAGHPLVWAAVLCDVGTCLLVIFNSMLLLRGVAPPKQGKHCCKSKAKTVLFMHTDHSSCKDIESLKSCASRTCSSEDCGSKCAPSDSTSASHVVNRCSSTTKEHSHKGHSHTHEHDHGHSHSHHQDHKAQCHSHNHDHKGHSHTHSQDHKGHSHTQDHKVQCHSHNHPSHCCGNVTVVSVPQYVHHHAKDASSSVKVSTPHLIPNQSETQTCGHEVHSSTCCNIASSESSVLQKQTVNSDHRLKSEIVHVKTERSSGHSHDKCCKH